MPPFCKAVVISLYFDKYSETYRIGIAMFLISRAKNHNVVQTLCVCVSWPIFSAYRTDCTEVQNLSFMIQVFWDGMQF